MRTWIGAVACAALTGAAGCGDDGGDARSITDYVVTVDRHTECEFTRTYVRCAAENAVWNAPADAPRCRPPEFTAIEQGLPQRPPRFTCWTGIPPKKERPRASAYVDPMGVGSFLASRSFACRGQDKHTISCSRFGKEPPTNKYGFTISRERLRLRPTLEVRLIDP